MAFALTGGEALYGLGFQALLCMDTSQGHPGVRKTAMFHPNETDPLKRYGGIDIFGAIEFMPDQNAGAHARGDQGLGSNFLAPELLPQVLARQTPPLIIAPNRERDTADLSLLRNATQWVIREALRLGLLAPAAPQVDPPAVVPPSPPVPPVQPPAPSVGLRPLSPASVRVEELRSMATGFPALGAGAFFVVVATALSVGNGGLWPSTRPFAVELLRFYRLLRKRLGDPREIPAEDR